MNKLFPVLSPLPQYQAILMGQGYKHDYLEKGSTKDKKFDYYSWTNCHERCWIFISCYHSEVKLSVFVADEPGVGIEMIHQQGYGCEGEAEV